MGCRVAEGLAQESDVFLSRHLARGHGEFAVLGAATPHHAPDLHVVRRVQERHRRLLVAEQTIQVRHVARISTEEAMRAELPDVTGLAHRRKRKPVSLDVISRVGCALLEVTHERVNLDWLETGDGDVEAFLNEELGEFGEFDSQTLPVPTGILGDFVVREQKRPLFCLAQATQPDGGYFLEATKFRGLEATVPGKKRRGLIDDHRHGEAKSVNALGDLVDLFFRMRVRVARVGLDRVKRRQVRSRA